MSEYRINISCPSDGSDVELVNATTNGLLAVAVVECHTCEREWEVTCRLVPHGPNRAAVERAKKAKLRRRVMVPA